MPFGSALNWADDQHVYRSVTADCMCRMNAEPSSVALIPAFPGSFNQSHRKNTQKRARSPFGLNLYSCTFGCLVSVWARMILHGSNSSVSRAVLDSAVARPKWLRRRTFSRGRQCRPQSVESWVLVDPVCSVRSAAPRASHRCNHLEDTDTIQSRVDEHVVDGEWTLLRPQTVERAPVREHPRDFASCSSQSARAVPSRLTCSLPCPLVAQAFVPFEMCDEFVLVPETISTVSRSFTRQRPELASATLWTCFVVLWAGEMATTLHFVALSWACEVFVLWLLP